MKKINLLIFLLLLTPFISAQVSSISLEKYCPNDEGQKGAICFAYATTYSALSIEHNVKNNKVKGSDEFKTFSYGFVASKVKKNKSFWGRMFNRCGRNATAKLALDVLKENGTVIYKQFPEKCKCKKTDRLLDEAGEFKIQSYEVVGNTEVDDAVHIESIKSRLKNKKPVITTIYQVGFFRSANEQEDILFPDGYQKKPNNANHVVCIVGFDDNRNGGSFLVKNNYKAWGKDGFAYVKYEDYLKLVRTSYVINL